MENDDVFWRVIYVFPAIIHFMMLVGFYTLIKTEPIIHSIRTGDDVSALALIDKVYDRSEDRDQILRVLKTEISEPQAGDETWF